MLVQLLMVLLHGFIKKSRKTPQKDMELALKRKKGEGRREMKGKNIGASFDKWLREEGIQEEVTAGAIKRVLARQVKVAMEQEGLSKTEMARRMQTSRSSLERLLDPGNESVTLMTMQKAAAAIGRELRLELV